MKTRSTRTQLTLSQPPLPGKGGAALPTPVIACDLGAIAREDRLAHGILAGDLFGHVDEIRELPDGYAFRFGARSFSDLASFVSKERLCCPFIKFSLELGPGVAPVWLRLTGGIGVKRFIRAQFVGAARR